MGYLAYLGLGFRLACLIRSLVEALKKGEVNEAHYVEQGLLILERIGREQGIKALQNVTFLQPRILMMVQALR